MRAPASAVSGCPAATMPGGQDRFTLGSCRGPHDRGQEELRRVAQRGQARIGHVDHPLCDERAQGRKALVAHHLVERPAIAPQHDRFQAIDGGHQHAHGDVGRCLQRGARLALATAREAPRARAALAMAAVHEPATDLRVRQLRSLEHARRVAAEAHQEYADRALTADVVEQRARPYPARSPRTATSSGANGGSHTTRSPSAPTKATSRSPTDVHATFSWRSAQRSSQRSRRAGGSS